MNENGAKQPRGRATQPQFIRITSRSFHRESIFNDYCRSPRESKTDDRLLLVVNGVDAAVVGKKLLDENANEMRDGNCPTLDILIFLDRLVF